MVKPKIKRNCKRLVHFFGHCSHNRVQLEREQAQLQFAPPHHHVAEAPVVKKGDVSTDDLGRVKIDVGLV